MLAKQRRAAAQDALARASGQLAQARAQAQPAIQAFEHAVDNLWADYLERLRASCGRSGVARRLFQIDDWLRTDRDEFMDREDFPERERQRALGHLHRLNIGLDTYRRSFNHLWPTLERAALRTPGPVRVLELASGHGEFVVELAGFARTLGFDLALTGSDIQPGHVERARAHARELGLAVEFLTLDALDMREVPSDAYDVVVMMQAMHHFRPGPLARIIAEATRVASVGFIGIDMLRAPWLVPVLGVGTLVATANRYLAYDAAVSALKAYDAVELELIARASAPQALIRCTRHAPGVLVLQVLAAPV